MGIADELQKLEQLRQNGTLTDDEFARVKTQLLNIAPGFAAADVGPYLETQLIQLRNQNELKRLDEEWEIERRQYQLAGRFRRRYIPTMGTGLMTAVVGGILGAAWTAAALTLKDVSSRFRVESGWLMLILKLMPLVGIIIMTLAIMRGIFLMIVAQNYNVAYHRHMQKRSQFQ